MTTPIRRRQKGATRCLIQRSPLPKGIIRAVSRLQPRLLAAQFLLSPKSGHVHCRVADLAAREVLHYEIQEAPALFRTERMRELLQERYLLVGEAKCVHIYAARHASRIRISRRSLSRSMSYSGRQSSPLTTTCHAPSAVRLNSLHRSANRRSSLACARTASARSCGVLFSQIRLMSLLPTTNGPLKRWPHVGRFTARGREPLVCG